MKEGMSPYGSVYQYHTLPAILPAILLALLPASNFSFLFTFRPEEDESLTRHVPGLFQASPSHFSNAAEVNHLSRVLGFWEEEDQLLSLLERLGGGPESPAQ